MAYLWTYTEQQQIKPISKNFPLPDFEQMQAETQIEDLQELLGFDFYQDIIQNPTSTANAELLAGGSYVYNGVTYTFSGLKYVLAYFLFAKYVRHSAIKDTYSGFVKKNYEESREITKGDGKNYHLDFRKLAFKYWDECSCYIRANSSNFPYYYTDPPPRSCWSSDSYRRGFCF